MKTEHLLLLGVGLFLLSRSSSGAGSAAKVSLTSGVAAGSESSILSSWNSVTSSQPFSTPNALTRENTQVLSSFVQASPNQADPLVQNLQRMYGKNVKIESTIFGPTEVAYTPAGALSPMIASRQPVNAAEATAARVGNIISLGGSIPSSAKAAAYLAAGGSTSDSAYYGL